MRIGRQCALTETTPSNPLIGNAEALQGTNYGQSAHITYQAIRASAMSATAHTKFASWCTTCQHSSTTNMGPKASRLFPTPQEAMRAKFSAPQYQLPGPRSLFDSLICERTSSQYAFSLDRPPWSPVSTGLMGESILRSWHERGSDRRIIIACTYSVPGTSPVGSRIRVRSTTYMTPQNGRRALEACPELSLESVIW